tara:strand:+ start:312 stop:896 length:585 start_codon:yes stop_codon:yes gene_type:complete
MNTKILCLAALSLGKASGYDIGKRLEEPLGFFVDTAKSGVYPALKCLHEEGLVQYEDIEQSSLPNKKIFELTDKGRNLLKAELEALAPTHKLRSQFMLLLFFAEMLSTDRLEAIINERIQDAECFLQEVPKLQKYVENNIGQQFLLDFLINKANVEKEYLQQNLESLIAKMKLKDKQDMQDLEIQFKEMENINE